jgi:hypothetical protein
MSKPSLHIVKLPMTGDSSDDSDLGVTDCSLARSKRRTISSSLGATVDPLPRIFGNEIVPAKVVVIAAAIAGLRFAGTCQTATLARSADTAQRGRLPRHTLGDLRPNMALVGIAPTSHSANTDRRGR